MLGLSPRYWPRLVTSLLLATAVIVPMAVVITTQFQRNARLDALGSADPLERELALNHLVRDITVNPKRAELLTERIPTLPNDAVIQVINALALADAEITVELRGAFEQRLSTLEPHHFLAVFDSLYRDEQPPASAFGPMVNWLSDESLPESQRKQFIARLDHFGQWQSPPVPMNTIVSWITRGSHSADPALRRQTAQQLGDLPIAYPALDPQTTVLPALKQLAEDDAASVCVAALTALAGFAAQHPGVLDTISHSVNDPNPFVAEWAKQLIAIGQSTPPTQADRNLPTPTAEAINQDDRRAWADQLIAFESVEPGSLDIAFSDEMPHLVRVAATHAAREAQPDWLYFTLCLDDRPAVRDTACLVIAQRFDLPQIETMVQSLLNDHDPDGHASAAILSGLTGGGKDRLANANNTSKLAPKTRRLVQVGLWMQGDADLSAEHVVAMLGRPGLDDSTLLLALLHRGERRAALDNLLGLPNLGSHLPSDKTSTPPHTLPAWLLSERWLRVLDAYLPADAPRFDTAAAPAEFHHQTLQLTAWHALHRHQTPEQGLPQTQP